MLKRCNDQGVLNILTWSGQFGEAIPVTILTAKSGAVLHANTEWEFSWQNQGIVETQTGEKFAIVHQWDRIARLHKTVPVGLQLINRLNAKARMKGIKTFWSQPMQSWSAPNRQAIPECVVDASGTVVVCVSGIRAAFGVYQLVFCPTHEVVELVNNATAELFAKVDGVVGTAVSSSLHRCVSQTLLSKCVSKRWCQVSNSERAAAVKKCGGSDVTAVGILYSCVDRSEREWSGW